MILNINVTELNSQATRYSTEIFASRTARQRADTQLRNIKRAIEAFGEDLETARTRLNELLTQATLAVSEMENRVMALNAQAEQAVRRKDAAATTVRRLERELGDMRRSALAAPTDTYSARAIMDAQNSLASQQSRLSALRVDIHRAEDRVADARNDLSELRDVVRQIRLEINETNRLSMKAFLAAIKTNDYQATDASYQISIERAQTLAENVKGFANDLESADASSAAGIERDFIALLQGQPTYEMLIIQNAQSQVGALETSDNFVAGKPYAQQSLAWCADFVRWVMEESGIDIDASGRDALGSSYAVARAWAVHGAEGGGYGRWGSSGDAQPGDLLIDRYDGTDDPGGHISIVIEINVNGNPFLVRTIGGNEDNPRGGNDGVIEQVKNLNEEERYLVTLSELNN